MVAGDHLKYEKTRGVLRTIFPKECIRGYFMHLFIMFALELPTFSKYN